MNTAVPWFFVLLAVMLGGVTLLVFLFVASRIFGNRSGGGVPPRRASDDLSPIGAVPSPLGDDSLTNPANPLYHLHHLGATNRTAITTIPAQGRPRSMRHRVAAHPRTPAVPRRRTAGAAWVAAIRVGTIVVSSRPASALPAVANPFRTPAA